MARAPSPKEYDLHVALAQHLHTFISGGWIFTHIGHGEKRDPITGARLKRMGVVAGFPDFVFYGPHRAVFFLELKRKGGKLSDHQVKVSFDLMRCGFTYHCTDNLKDALHQLSVHGIIVRTRVSA